ncbi:MAG: tripartite tricarboxylate transporter TctB family protein [Acidobacteria bacterium]|nr:tripartite tricarboxylate transporter TctB family protein [Acidobacteriota bacterium]
MSGLGEFAPSISAGQLRALAISSPSRVAELDAPTLREAGVELDLANWRAVVAPPGVSDVEAAALTAQVRAAVGSAAWRDTLTRTGWTDLYLDGAPVRQFLLAEGARVNAVLARLAQGTPATPTAWRPTASTAPALALAPAHAFLEPLMGFVPTATLDFAAGAAALGSRRHAGNACVGVVVALVIVLVFGAGLGVPLPLGAWWP